MPIIHTIKQADYEIGIWKISENEAELKELLNYPEIELDVFQSIQNPRRRLEWLVVRLLLQEISGETLKVLHYNNDGKPFLSDGSHHISISHSREYVAVITSEKFTVGIDIEKREPRIHKIAHKFVSDSEWNFLGPDPGEEELYLIWSAKESLFKIYSKGDMDFRKEMRIEPFVKSSSGKMVASIHKNTFHKEYVLHYIVQDTWSLVWGVDR